MKQDSKKRIYDLAKRFRYGLLTEIDVKELSEKQNDDDFYKRLDWEMDDEWQNLEDISYERQRLIKKDEKFSFKKNTKIRFYSILIASTAAIAIIAFFAFPIIKDEINRTQQLTVSEFAQKSKRQTVNELKETQLILSETKTIMLEKKDGESQVIYNKDHIAVDDKLIAKESASAFNQLITAKGKRSKVILSDGTKIWVNSDTRVVYPTQFNANVREIYVDGEIYIEVAKEKKRKFKVNTKNFSVQVLGTKFNVSSYEGEHKEEIVLVEGKVSVTREATKSSSIIMNPNELLEITKTGEKVSKVNTAKYTSWTQGLYYLENETLSQVISFLSKYYGVNIQCDPEIAAIRCSGKIDLKTGIDKICNILFISQELSCVKQKDDYYIFKKSNP